MKTPALLLVSVTSLALVGCAGSRKSQAVTAEAVAASHESTIRRAVSGTVAPSITVSGSSNVVTVAPSPQSIVSEVTDQANTKGDASGESRTSFRVSFSTWLAVGAACVAFTGLLIGWLMFSRGSATGAAADAGLAEVIRLVRSRMATATDSREIAAHAAQLAELEAARGRLK